MDKVSCIIRACAAVDTHTDCALTECERQEAEQAVRSLDEWSRLDETEAPMLLSDAARWIRAHLSLEWTIVHGPNRGAIMVDREALEFAEDRFRATLAEMLR